MDDLQKIQNGEYQSMRKNEAGRWVANDILRKGNPYRSYDMLPGTNGVSHNPTSVDSNFAKIPPEMQHELTADALKIAKLKMDNQAINGQRMETPDEMKRHLR